MRVAAVVVQKNEVDCLRPWVAYHGYLLGMENIYILDNNSDDESVLQVLDSLKDMGVSVHKVPANEPFERRGAYTTQLIQKIEEKKNYDFLFPMDCDEFLFSWTAAGVPTCDRFEFMNSLSRFRGAPETLGITGGLENINGEDTWMNKCRLKKAFFTSKNGLNLDIGFHNGYSKMSTQTLDTNIGYLHYHWRPFSIYRDLARAKMRPFVDVDNLEALQAYGRPSPNYHLVPYLLMSEDDYNAKLVGIYDAQKENRLEFKEFHNIMKFLGISPGFIRGEGRSVGV